MRQNLASLLPPEPLYHGNVTMTQQNTPKIAVIGFGEAGSCLCKGWGRGDVRALAGSPAGGQQPGALELAAAAPDSCEEEEARA